MFVERREKGGKRKVEKSKGNLRRTMNREWRRKLWREWREKNRGEIKVEDE